MTGGRGAGLIPNHWVRAILDVPHLAEHTSDALRTAGLSHDDLRDAGTLIPRGAETVLLNHFSSRLKTPFAGAEIGIALNPRNSALLTYILFNSTTLLDALHHIRRFTPVTRPRARIELLDTPDHVDFVVDGVGSDLRLETHLIEFSLAALLGAFRAATGESQLTSRIGLANPRRSGQRALSEIYGSPVELNAQHSYLRFPRSRLSLPIVNADAGLLDHLTRYGEVLLARVNPNSGTLSDTIQRHLLHGMAAGRPQLSETAATFGMSERTLNRRLRDEGTSFRDLVAATQLKLAKSFLSDPNLSLAETAHLCGFSDQSSFTQAYRRWTGRTPNSDRILLIKKEELQ
jgi:AraC-like DNA-binding protein